jgi:hypothetical protein
MNRVTIAGRLALAERRVAAGEEHLGRQRGLISELERHGRSADQARDLLRVLEDTHALHVAHRDRLRKQLGAAAEPHRSALEIERAVFGGPTATRETSRDYAVGLKRGSNLPMALILAALASIAVLGVTLMWI